VGSINIVYAQSASHPLITQWGESGNRNGEFFNPQNIATDSEGNVYVTDLGNRRVQQFDNDGTFLKAWGSSGSGAGQFNSISGIAVDENSVYVVDNQLSKIQKFDVSILSSENEGSIPMEETDFWKEMQSNRVGNLLAGARLKANLTQAQLAAKLDVRQNMISDYERGKRRLSPSMAKRIAKILNINIDRLS